MCLVDDVEQSVRTKTMQFNVQRNANLNKNTFYLTGQYKMQTADCRLGIKCRLRPKSPLRQIQDTFSVA